MNSNQLWSVEVGVVARVEEKMDRKVAEKGTTTRVVAKERRKVARGRTRVLVRVTVGGTRARAQEEILADLAMTPPSVLSRARPEMRPPLTLGGRRDPTRLSETMGVPRMRP